MDEEAKDYIKSILDLLNILPENEVERIHDYLNELYLT